MRIAIKTTKDSIDIGLSEGSSLDDVSKAFGRALGSLVHNSCRGMNPATAESVQPSLMSDCAKQIIDEACSQLFHLGTFGVEVDYKCYKI